MLGVRRERAPKEIDFRTDIFTSTGTLQRRVFSMLSATSWKRFMSTRLFRSVSVTGRPPIRASCSRLGTISTFWISRLLGLNHLINRQRGFLEHQCSGASFLITIWSMLQLDFAVTCLLGYIGYLGGLFVVRKGSVRISLDLKYFQ